MEPPGVPRLGGFSSLHHAVMNKNDDVTEVITLLDVNADINQKTNNAQQETSLHRAVRCGNVAVVRLLLERGANLHAKNSGEETPLTLAERRTAEFYRLFAEFGYTFSENDWKLIEELNSDVSQEKVFSSALERAGARGELIEVLCLLLLRKKDEQNDDLENALVFASGQGHEPIVEILLHAGVTAFYAHIVTNAALLRINWDLMQSNQDENLKKKKEAYECIREKLNLLKNFILTAPVQTYFCLLPLEVRKTNCLPCIFPSFLL